MRMFSGNFLDKLSATLVSCVIRRATARENFVDRFFRNTALLELFSALR